jgi:hypothetical protein
MLPERVNIGILQDSNSNLSNINEVYWFDSSHPKGCILMVKSRA